MAEKRVCLVGFDRQTAGKMEEHGIKIVSHIYANPEDKAKTYPDRPDLINFHNWKRYRFDATRQKPTSTDTYLQVKKRCFQDFIRCTDRFDWSRELVDDWSDYDHLFSLALDHASEWLKKHQPDRIFYSNVPHQGIAIAQYHLASHLGIKTSIFVQSQFEGRSWLVDHWRDLGKFSTSLAGEPFEIDISEPKSAPFYMNTVRSDAKRKINATAHKLRARFLITFGLTGLSRDSRAENFKRNLGRWKRAADYQDYLHKAPGFFKDEIPQTPFVYFPLHLQPEMTTDILGRKYADQLLALETLREITPAETTICVKENPKQTGRLRSDAFFKRLARLPNTVFVSRDVPSLELTRNSMAVATITGTAGWEALRMGKPVIVFGDAFWNRLPGTFTPGENFDWRKITEFNYQPEKLKEAVHNLSRYARPGVSDVLYSKVVKNFDASENAVLLANTIKDRLIADD